MAPKSEAEGSHFPADAFHCPEREWWDLEKRVGADQTLGTSSLSLHSDCKPNTVSSSLQKEEKENLHKPR